MSFDRLISEIIAREGGYVADPDDPGGPTNHGITQATLAEWRGRPVAPEEVAALTREEAATIYRARYYEAPRLSLAPHVLQPFLLDAAVNHGPVEAVRMLQRVLADTGAEGLDIDGRLGPATARAARAALDRLGNWLLAALADERRRVYFGLVAARPQLSKFLDGWIARANAFDPRQTPVSDREHA